MPLSEPVSAPVSTPHSAPLAQPHTTPYAIADGIGGGTATAPEITAVLAAANRIILGKEIPIRLALACLLARGHLLIEDLPGVGKTTLAHTLARLLGLDFQRVQFTSDMLPADILGTSIFDREKSSFRFLPGPVFTQVVLADEINRATPKTQSALLEAMEEGQVTVEGETRPLPEPFFVIATQNPSHQIGTFPLPESQLDRFLLRLSLGYPDSRAERALLESGDRRSHLAALQPCLSPADLPRLQAQAAAVHAAPALLDYVQALVEATRRSAAFRHGLSPRAALALLAVARAWAYLAGRPQVLPEDIQAVWPWVVSHRLPLAQGGSQARPEDALALLHDVPLP
ncbi:hypothetical protein AZSI13_23010 [Azospira sp. I13]|uniref:AAA family ATPase n=1 Tax=Azospira sp. I13 TaxID=1765050 RepID=UPI000D4BC735|nr:AAA family ATPase [Azospira sp. I13]GBG02974.1 hypothetical protein AZSI13_23010 [Azospira sp. I13]